MQTVLLIGLAVFFGLQFLSRFVSSLGSRTGVPVLYEAGALCFPIEAEPFYRYGNALLNDDPTDGGAGLDRGISFLQRSLSLNPFNYRAHFELGKARLSHLPLTDEMFRKGIAGLKRSVRLGGGKNTDVGRRALELLIDHWPRLRDTDKILCRKLLKNVIGKMDDANFEALLGRWEVSSRDVTLFEGVLETAPRFYDLAAGALTRLEIEPELRRLFKVNHEIYTLEDVKEQYRNLSNRPDLTAQLKALRLRLKKNIKGYYQLVRNSKFKRQHYRELLTRLNFHILSRLFTAGNPLDPPQQREMIEDFLLSCIDDFSSSSDMEDLYRLLDKNKFFSSGDARSQYIRGLLLYKQRDYAAVIAHLERVKFSASTGYGEHGDEYPRILLLLADAYIASRLLTKAQTVLTEIETRPSPSVLMEMYLRKARIDYIIGPGAVGKGQPSKYHDLLAESRKIELIEPSSRTEVYLVNGSDGPDIDEIEIRPGHGLKERIKDRHLLQVFIDGKIRHDVYLSQLDFDKPINIKVSPFERFSKHTIQVIII